MPRSNKMPKQQAPAQMPPQASPAPDEPTLPLLQSSQSMRAQDESAPAPMPKRPPPALLAPDEPMPSVTGVLQSNPELVEALPRPPTTCLLLTQAILPCLRQHSRGGEHAAARAALNDFCTHGGDLVPTFPWREYLATHPMAAELVGPGVTSFVFQEIADTRDPNRGGLPRVDFLVHRADGSAYRLHPGKTRKQDAKPHYLPPTSFAGESTATEHTCTSSSSASAFSWSEARLIPQSDRIGKRQAYQRLHELREENLPSCIALAGFLDLSDGAMFPWKLWFANLGHSTNAILGNGILRVQLSLDDEPEIMLRLTRADETEVHLFVSHRTFRFM